MARAKSGGYTIQNNGGTTGLTIDSSGRVLMPQVPMFQVHAAGNQYVSDDGLVEYDTEDHDVGGNFDTSTYKFTAPVNGYYHMHAHVYTATNSGEALNINYQVNDATYGGTNLGLSSSIYSYAYHTSGGVSHAALDLPLIMKLTAKKSKKTKFLILNMRVKKKQTLPK